MWIALFALWACKPGVAEVVVPGGTTDDNAPPPITDEEPTETAQTGETGPTGDTAPDIEAIDCANLPPQPVSTGRVLEARGYHGLAIMSDGNIIGSDGNSLIQADYYGNGSVFRPNIGWTEQFTKDEDDNLYILRDGSVSKVTYPEGAIEDLTNIPGGMYGITMGPDGMLYTANQNVIHRVDPQTGNKSVLLDTNHNPKVLEFSVNGDVLYYGTNFNQGRVYSVPLDADMNPTAAPTLYATTPGSWHDGLAVDICGNLYIAEYNNRALYRVSPGGNTSTVYAGSGSNYGHGTVWGTGVGGFREDALYQPQPYNQDTVGEIVLGVPGKDYQGPVINQPF